MKASAKLTKKPVYQVPIVPLAKQALPTRGANDQPQALLFPGLNAGPPLKAKLVKAGAPEDFMLHTFRHTIATWLQNKGHSEWEVGLVLNHSGSG